MTGQAPWRDLRSVMLVTLHVAILAYVFRVVIRPQTSSGMVFLGIFLTIVFGFFLTWPISRALAAAFDPRDGLADRLCPRCGRHMLRPLLRSSRGIFQPLTGYRCAGCWSTFRVVGERTIEEVSTIELDHVIDPHGIEFLDAAATPEEVRFLDETSDLSH